MYKTNRSNQFINFIAVVFWVVASISISIKPLLIFFNGTLKL
jgi:hypothetical protein